MSPRNDFIFCDGAGQNLSVKLTKEEAAAVVATDPGRGAVRLRPRPPRLDRVLYSYPDGVSNRKALPVRASDRSHSPAASCGSRAWRLGRSRIGRPHTWSWGP